MHETPWEEQQISRILEYTPRHWSDVLNVEPSAGTGDARSASFPDEIQAVAYTLLRT